MTATPEALLKWFDLAKLQMLSPQDLAFPTQQVLTVARAPLGRQAELARWGFIPSWAKPGGAPPLINARSETINEKPTFSRAFRSSRCVVPAVAYFEWQHEGKTKLPWRFSLPGDQLFAFAALSAPGKLPGEPAQPCVTLLTREASPALAAVHARMPVLLDQAGVALWLQPDADETELLARCQAAPPALCAVRVASDLSPLPD